MIKIKFADSEELIEVGFSKVGNNIVTLKGNVPVKECGFFTYKLDGTYLGDFTNYNTVYKILADGVQFSNDGSQYVAPPKVVSVSWNDEDDKEGFRPEEVSVKVTINEEDEEIIVLNAENDWRKEYALDDSDYVVAEFDSVEGYTLDATDTTATYTHECIPEPTLEERVSDLEEAVCELADAL